jgi:membrane-associated protease RseP (regulator of RpoE activity)
MSTYIPTMDDLTARLRAGLAGLFQVDDTTTGVGDPDAVRFRGRFLVAPDEAYERVRAHFATLGYTPFFRRDGEQDAVVAGPGVVEVQPSRWWINAVLFVLTVLSVIYVGTYYSAPDGAIDSLRTFLLYPFAHLADGLLYGVPLLAILLCHEFGHYIAARRHGVAVTLPYFIPLPVPPLGTMGAAIVQKEPYRNRKVLFDVGVAGPLAGLIVAIPVLIYGLTLSQITPIVPGSGLEGNSLLYLALKFLVFGKILPGNGIDVYIGPVAFAGWVGLLVTSFNLLPAGQLDGGHIAYVLFGERTRRFTQVIIVAMLVMGVLPGVLDAAGLPSFGWYGWLLWAGLIYVFGRGHPPLLDDLTQLDPRRRALAWFMIVVFVLVFIPIPWSVA